MNDTLNDINIITVEDLGVLLSVSKRQVYRLKASGKLPKEIRIGNSIRWRRSDIQMWIALGCPGMGEFESRKEVA